MTEHPLVLVRDRVRETPVKPKHPLGELDAARIAKHLVLFKPALENVDLLVAKARAHIPGMTNNLTVHKVVSHNQDCLWAIGRRKRLEAGDTVGDGFIAMLPLNAAGLAQLAANTLDTRDPDLKYIAPAGQRPAVLGINLGKSKVTPIEEAIASAIPRSSDSGPGCAPGTSISVTTGIRKRSASAITRIAFR